VNSPVVVVAECAILPQWRLVRVSRGKKTAKRNGRMEDVIATEELQNISTARW
jgi:hypothetical protein